MSSIPTLPEASVSPHFFMFALIELVYKEPGVCSDGDSSSPCICFPGLSDSVAKESCMVNLLLSLPETNLVTFLFVLDHLKRYVLFYLCVFITSEKLLKNFCRI